MNYLLDFLHNRLMITAVSAWGIAQIVKTIIDFCLNKKVHFERLIGAGGMPSCHSSTVCSLATMAGLVYGLDSFQFAFAGVLAIIVMYDASGVRRETGNQAILLNEMMEVFKKLQTPEQRVKFSQEKLKEFIGHTPFQVFVGAILGIVIASLLYFLVFTRYPFFNV